MQFLFFKNKNDNKKYLVTLIFITGIILRLALVPLNRDANDNHIEVVTRMLSGLSVDKNACWECFQPKLYHGSVAFFAYIFKLQSTLSITILGELLCALSGILSIYIIWKFIKEQKANAVIKMLCFGLIALNPIFIGMNAQATNDSYIILFGILSLYYLSHFFLKPTLLNAILLLLSVNLSLLSKGNGVVVVLAVSILLLIQSIGAWAIRKSPKPFISTLFALGITCTIASVFFAPYYEYYQKYKDPFVINWTKPPLPKLFTPTYNTLYRPGIVTVFDGFFTFRFINLLQYPYISHGYTNYSLQRTSFWSQVYGNSESIFFEQAPASWVNMTPLVQDETRIILILALLPTLLLFTGFIVVSKRIVCDVKHFKLKALFNNKDILYLTYFTLFLMMLVYYSYVWRDFSHMKGFFIYPALLSIAALLIEGMQFYYKKFKQNFLNKAGALIIGLLVCFYVINIMTLIAILLPKNFP